MTIESMTGFARSSGASGSWRFTWEVRSVNGRSLDVKMRLAPPLDDLVDDVRKRVGAAIARGNVQIGLTLTNERPAGGVRIDERALEAVATAARDVAARLGMAPPGLDAILSVRGIVELADAEPDGAAIAALRAAALEAFDRALASLLAMRRSEGTALLTVVRDQVSRMEALSVRAEQHPGRTPDAVRARLETAVAALLEASGNLDPQRLHQEAILLAAKADIREELDRLMAHVAAARAHLAEGAAVGRRLDFLAQEFGREANTLCAKSNDIALTSIGLELKAVVEQFREQVQNIA